MNTTNSLKKYQKALNGFADIFNNAKSKQKHKYIYPLKSSGITYVHARKLGYNVTTWLWKTCSDRSERKKGNDY